MGMPDEAVLQFEKAGDIFENQLGPKHRNTLRNRTFIGMVPTACGRQEEARTHLEETLHWQRAGQVRPADLQATEEALVSF